MAGATGVWTSDTRALLGEDPTDDAAARTPSVLPSKGVHLVVPRSAIALHTALIARTRSSVLFLLPWGQTWLVGTTDSPWAGDRDEPTATAEDVDYLLAEANRWLVRPLTRDDVMSVYVGLRPLLGEGDADVATTKVSREHAVTRPAPGLVQIAGGKYTTYRVMARDLVDAAAADLPFTIPASRTDEVLLVGAEGFEDAWADREGLGERTGLGEAQARRMLRRYGGDIGEVLALGADDARLLRAGPSGRAGARCRGPLCRDPRGGAAPRGRPAAPDPARVHDLGRSPIGRRRRRTARSRRCSAGTTSRVAEEVAAFESVAPQVPPASG